MIFYQFLIILTVIVLSFFPNQLDIRLVYILSFVGVLLLPIFFKNLRKDLTSKKIPLIFFVLFLLTLALSTVFSIDKTQSLRILPVFFVYFVIFFASKYIFDSLKNKERLAIVFILTTLILSLFSLYHTIILHHVVRTGNGVSFLWAYYGHNHLSALLLFSIPLAFYFLKIYWDKKNLRLLSLLVVCCLLFSFIFTFARASFVALIAAFALTAFLFRPKLSPKAIIGVLLFLITFGLAFSVLASQAKQFNIRKYGIESSKTRLIYYQIALENFIARPLVGSGLDTFRFVSRASEKTTKLSTNYAHNFFLQMLTDAGILGFLSSVGLIFWVLWLGLKRVKEKGQTKEGLLLTMFWVGLLASTLNSLVDFDWQIPTVLFVFWLIAGLFL